MAQTSESLYARCFAADVQTERALRAGLAGREANVQRGRLAVALRTLAAEPSPPIVFVDFDGVTEPDKAARELVAICALGTAIIAIGSTDTAQLTRTLLRHGFADYLVKPVTAAAVREACATVLDDLPERTHAGRVIALGGTAGSGVSTLTAAIARGIGSGGRTAAIVDLNPVSGTLTTLLGTKPAGDLPALLDTLETGSPSDSAETDTALDPEPHISPEQLDSVCAAAGAGISLVACPVAGPLPEPPSPNAVCTLLGALANRAHVVLVTGMLDPGARTEIMRWADARVLLYEPTLASIGAAVQTLALLGADQATTLVQCHPRMRRSELSPAQIRYALAERRPDVVIPFDPALHAATTGEAQGRSRGKPYLDALHQVMARVVEGAAPMAAD